MICVTITDGHMTFFKRFIHWLLFQTFIYIYIYEYIKEISKKRTIYIYTSEN